eukprot:CAMPEP_0117752114 /NCGR_PEP_ID=MMETSP0947-20121206/11409_1 /TAXON_ID=44440 /ORGANISM="Chattonella subsalsa, Strain CCMP2191" /LENGTH=99 /DNA_ID=CAMNT_0005570687 /DNA_START=209 /DNA_END=508 /DNA_ORIENTATION=+
MILEADGSDGMTQILEDFSTFEGVVKLFQNKDVVLGAWSHYICFDLLVGYWCATDAAEKGVPHLLVVPCLFLTCLFGPTGFLMYHIIRFFYAGFKFKRS